MKFFTKNLLSFMLVFCATLHGTPINFIVPSQITAGSFTISSPGLYLLVDDTTFSPGAAATAITISSNNVTLDLNGKYLIGGNANANHGIELPASRNDIIIKNGYIADFAGTGIKADAGTTYTTITLQDLTIKNRNKTGTCISFANASDCFVTRCQCSGANSGASFSTSSRFQLLDSTFSNNAATGISLTTCQNFKVTNCQANFSVADGAIGFNMSACNAIQVQNGIFNGTVSTAGGTGLGTRVLNSTGISFDVCEFCRNANAGLGDAAGLNLDGSSGVIVKNCSFNDNTAGAGTASGIKLSSAAQGNELVVCTAADNFTTGSGAANGFDVRATSSNNYFVDCVALRNRSSSGSSAGFSVASDSVGNIIKNCEAYNNTGGGANQGFLDNNATATNWYLGNLAFGQGANNYVGVSTGSVTVNVAAQPPQGSFDERGIDNISAL